MRGGGADSALIPQHGQIIVQHDVGAEVQKSPPIVAITVHNLTGRRPTQPGSQAVRQPGNQAARQLGRQAGRQAGSQQPFV